MAKAMQSRFMNMKAEAEAKDMKAPFTWDEYYRWKFLTEGKTPPKAGGTTLPLELVQFFYREPFLSSGVFLFIEYPDVFFFLMFLSSKVSHLCYSLISEKKDMDEHFKETLAREQRKWKVADTDGDGALSLEEFTAFIHPEEAPHMRDIVIEVRALIFCALLGSSKFVHSDCYVN